MAYDALISQTGDRFLDSLDSDDRHSWDSVLEGFLENPFPNDGSTVELPFPYPPGTFGHTSGDFWIVFQVLNPEVLRIASITWNPLAGRR